MSHKVVQGILAADVADAGTFTVSYPARTAPELASAVTDEGDFYLAMGHVFVLGNGGAGLNFPQDFDLTFGTASITVTNKSGYTWVAGTKWYLQLTEMGEPVWGERKPDGRESQRMARMAKSASVLMRLGAPDVADVDGVCAAQNIADAGNLLINGALAVGGAVILDVPRNLVVDSGGADDAVLTFYGTDEYGAAMVESITLNGTTAVPGKKAWKKITRVAASKAIANSAFVGTGDLLGLPAFLPGAGYVLKEMEDGAAATAGAFVAGIRVADGSTATSGDVRGTYDPNSACDGAKVFDLIVSLPDPGYRGIPQYAG